MNTKMRNQIRGMFKWAIMKMFKNNEGEQADLFQLKHELQNAWEELFDDGELVHTDEDN